MSAHMCSGFRRGFATIELLVLMGFIGAVLPTVLAGPVPHEVCIEAEELETDAG